MPVRKGSTTATADTATHQWRMSHRRHPLRVDPVQPVKSSSKTCRKAASASFIFSRACGVVERYVRFPDNLSLDHEQVHRHCAPKQRPVSVRKKVHANPAQGGQYRAEEWLSTLKVRDSQSNVDALRRQRKRAD